MGKGGLILVALAIVIALSATWLHKAWNQQVLFTQQLDKSKVDYYLSGFSLHVMDAQGQMKYKVAGEHFVHHVATKTSEIYKPTITIVSHNTFLSLVANKAIHHTSGDMELKDSTVLKKPVDKENAGFTLQTSDIIYSPTLKTVNTEAEILLKTTDGIILRGTGFNEDIGSMITRLKSNVHAEYTPQTQ